MLPHDPVGRNDSPQVVVNSDNSNPTCRNILIFIVVLFAMCGLLIFGSISTATSSLGNMVSNLTGLLPFGPQATVTPLAPPTILAILNEDAELNTTDIELDHDFRFHYEGGVLNSRGYSADYLTEIEVEAGIRFVNNTQDIRVEQRGNTFDITLPPIELLTCSYEQRRTNPSFRVRPSWDDADQLAEFMALRHYTEFLASEDGLAFISQTRNDVEAYYRDQFALLFPDFRFNFSFAERDQLAIDRTCDGSIPEGYCEFPDEAVWRNGNSCP